MKNKPKNKKNPNNEEKEEGEPVSVGISDTTIATRWPYLLDIVASKDVSRSNILELRVSESTLKQMGVANGTLCVLRHLNKLACVTVRSLEPNVKFGENLGLVGELVISNLTISTENNAAGRLEVMPLRSFASSNSISVEVSKHTMLRFAGMIDLNSTMNNSMRNMLRAPPEYISDNKSLQQMIISRCRGACVFQGNVISVQVASMVYYFNVFDLDKNRETLEDSSRVVKIGNQTRVELEFGSKCGRAKHVHPDCEGAASLASGDVSEANRRYGLDKIGGMSNLKDEIKKSIINPLRFSEVYSSFGVKPSRGVLLYGPPGTGKTLIARSIAEEIELIKTVKPEESELSVDFIVVDGSNINDGGQANDEDSYFFKCIQRVKENSKKEEAVYSILFIDEIDMICGNRDSFSGINHQSKKYLTAILSLLDGFDYNNSRVILIATTNKPNEVDPALRRAGRIDRELAVEVPNSLERREIIELILSEIPNSLTDSEIDSIVDETQAFVGADLKMLINESVNTLLERVVGTGGEGSPVLSFEDVSHNVRSIKPSALRELAIEIPKTHWSDIGGYEEVKEQLKECVEWPLVHSDLFEYMKIKPPSGVLLYGPPGCSKTLMAKAVATESRMNFISVKGPELFSKWVGESEKSIREIFRKARQNSPCVIFFDEIDAIGVNRENASNTSDVSTRVLSQMLNEMDGITTNKQVIVIGATNRPDLLDSALLRPGRLDRIIYIGLPDSEARRKILKIYLKKESFSQSASTAHVCGSAAGSKACDSNVQDRQEQELAELCKGVSQVRILGDFDQMIEQLVDLTKGYSGAELALLCRETMMQVIRRSISANRDLESHHNLFTWEDVSFALNKVRPRIPDSLIEFYENYNRDRSNI